MREFEARHLQRHDFHGELELHDHSGGGLLIRRVAGSGPSGTGDVEPDRASVAAWLAWCTRTRIPGPTLPQAVVVDVGGAFEWQIPELPSGMLAPQRLRSFARSLAARCA